MDFEQDQLKKTIDSVLAAGGRYADIRITTTWREDVKVRNGKIETMSSVVDRGLGVRVLIGNGWGFAASSEVSEPSLARVAKRACEVARASDRATADEIRLAPVDAYVQSWSSSYEIDPFAITLDRKAEHLLHALEAARSKPDIHQVMGEISTYRQRKIFASSEGSFLEQTTTEMGGGIEAIAVRGDDFQKRNYPNPMGGDYEAAGWEFIEGLDLAGNATRIADEAGALLDAPKSPAGTFDLIIGSSQLALQIHESCGHPTELDRALGWEISLAGGSFMQPSMLGNFQYGSENVTIVGDATIPRSIGSFAFDDDGVPAQRFPIIDRGMFANYQMGRDTAAALGRKSNGTVRAESATRIPIIRMTNINLEPGDASLEEIISSTKRGIFVDTNKSWSIDDLRLNFQFGCEVAYEVTDGKLGRLLKNPIYTGQTPAFWRSCDLVGNPSTWKMWGLPNCGKGDPMQTMRVAHGAPVARFRNVELA